MRNPPPSDYERDSSGSYFKYTRSFPSELARIPFPLDTKNDVVPIALYKGDETTRTIGIYVDGVLAASWTNSGSTAGLEIVNLDVTGQEVMLYGELDDSEWLSVKEVGKAHSLEVAS